MKKSRKQAPKPQTAEEMLAIASDWEMMAALDNMVHSGDGADYREMPELGRLITTLFEIDRVADAEGLGHYILHSGDRLADARTFLGAIGAEQKAAILKRVEDSFPGGKIPESESERWEAMFGSEESEDEAGVALEGVSKDWYLADEDILRLVRIYLEDRRAELDGLIANRAAKRVAIGKYVPLTEADIERMACAGEPQAFAGHEFELAEIERLPLLMQLAGDPACTARQRLFDALYAISGSVASEVMSGKQPRDLPRLQAALDAAGTSADEQMRDWSRRSQALLVEPDPLVVMDWMTRVIAP